MVVIGGSLGGYEAVVAILGDLAPDPGPPVAIVLHRAPGTFRLAANLSAATGCEVIEVADGERIRAGAVYLAPADYHLLVDRQHFSLSLDGPEAHSRPSIDALLTSAPPVFGAAVLGVLLTSSSEDGVEGLVAIRAAGGYTLVQSPESARSPIAPQAAIQRGACDEVVPLQEMSAAIRRRLARGGP